MELWNSILDVEGNVDPATEELTEELQKGIVKELTEALEDENSDNRLDNILLDDDHLLEQLTDQLAILNVFEAAAGGKLQNGGEDGDSEVSKEELEVAYLSVLDTLFKLSKLMNPLSGVGRDRLETGISMLREFEKLYWPLATKITKDNIESFRAFLPVEQYEEIAAGYKNAIGALRHVDGKLCAAGAIVYAVPFANTEGDPTFELEWIWVHEGLREQGIGDFLMAELLALALQVEESEIRATLPVQSFPEEDEEETEEAAALYNFLDDWGFGFSLLSGSRFAVEISDLKGSLVDMESDGPMSLKDLGENGPILLHSFLKKVEDTVLPDLLEKNYSWFDPDLSCVILKNGEIKTALLLHSFPGGDVRYEALRSLEKTEPLEAAELGRFAYSAHKALTGTEGNFYGEFGSEEGIKTAAKLMPKARSPLLYLGVLGYDEEAFTTEEWDKLREEAGLSGDMIPEEGLGGEEPGAEGEA